MSDVYKAPEAPLRDPVEAGEYGSIEKAIAGDYELRPVEAIKEAWAKLNGMKGSFWGAALIYGLCAAGFGWAQETMAGNPAKGNFSLGPYLIIVILQLIILTPMIAGLLMIGIKQSVGESVSFKEIFKHYDKTAKLFLTMLLFYVLVALGTLLFVLPGIYLMIAFSMAMPLVVEKNMGPWEALKMSRKAIHHKWFNMLGYGLLSMLIVMAGVLALLVGVIWAYPLIVLAYAIIYRDMFGVEMQAEANS